MRTLVTGTATLLGLLTGCVPGSAGDPSEAPADSVLAIVNVHVVPMDRDTVLPGRTVLVSDGRILTIGPSTDVEVPSGANVVPGEGRYLLPGLIDAHVHLSDARSELAMYVGYGVTTVFEMGARLDRVEGLLAFRDSLLRGEALGPTLYLAGPLIDGPEPIVPNRSLVVESPEDAEREAEHLHGQGVNFVKVYNRVPPEALRALGQATARLGLPLVGHIPREAGALASIDAGMDLIGHGEEFFFTHFRGPRSTQNLDRSWRPDTTLVAPLVDRLVHARVWVSPNLSFLTTNLRRIREPEAFWSDPDLEALDPNLIALWRDNDPRLRDDLDAFLWREEVKYELVREITKAFQEGGVSLLLGTDSALLVYATDQFYDPSDEGRLPWDDPDIHYDWETQRK